MIRHLFRFGVYPRMGRGWHVYVYILYSYTEVIRGEM
jgi:hypothetical protein